MQRVRRSAFLAGGRNFFARRSPLIMFKIKAGHKVNEQLRALFPAIGYGLFRQLGGAPSWSRTTRGNRCDQSNSICSPPNLVA